MTKENKAFLDQNYPMWQKFKMSGAVRGIGGYEIESMERIMGEEFLPGYRCQDKGCPPCIGDMIKLLFTNYDAWLEKNPVIVAANFPLNEKPTE